MVFESDWRGNTPKVGDNVWSGQALASLPLLQEMEVEAYVLEADAGGLKAGCPAQVVIEAQPEREVQGLRMAAPEPRPELVPCDPLADAPAVAKPPVAEPRTPGRKMGMMKRPSEPVLEKMGKMKLPADEL